MQLYTLHSLSLLYVDLTFPYISGTQLSDFHWQAVLRLSEEVVVCLKIGELTVKRIANAD
jgi:hypothetical protein